MKNIILTGLILFGFSIGLASCGKVVEDITAPAEPADTDELAPRVEPKSLEKTYNPLVEEEIESDEYPLQTEEMEDQPLFK